MPRAAVAADLVGGLDDERVFRQAFAERRELTAPDKFRQRQGLMNLVHLDTGVRLSDHSHGNHNRER